MLKADKTGGADTTFGSIEVFKQLFGARYAGYDAPTMSEPDPKLAQCARPCQVLNFGPGVVSRFGVVVASSGIR